MWSTNNLLSKNLVLYITIGVFVLGIIGYFAGANYKDKEAENTRIEKLDEVGIVLDKVKKLLDESDIDARTKRLKYCWRTGEKIGPGYRYCE